MNVVVYTWVLCEQPRLGLLCRNPVGFAERESVIDEKKSGTEGEGV